MLTLHETLSDINKDINAIKLAEHWNNSFLRNILEHAFIPEKKFILPEGTPPYKVNGLSGVETKGVVWQEARKLAIYARADLKPIRRESMFIQALESFDKDSVAVFLALKEQNLDSLYPNITREKLTEIGYLK